jgi:hypothetical protein
MLGREEAQKSQELNAVIESAARTFFAFLVPSCG